MLKFSKKIHNLPWKGFNIIKSASDKGCHNASDKGCLPDKIFFQQTILR